MDEIKLLKTLTKIDVVLQWFLKSGVKFIAYSVLIIISVYTLIDFFL